MNMEITKQFIDSVEAASKALRDKAKDVEILPESQEDSTCGKIIRMSIEECRLQSDMLDGWLIRARTSIGYIKE